MSQPVGNKITNPSGSPILGTIVALWGLFGFLATILIAIVRMMPVFSDMLAYSLSPVEISSLVASIILFSVGKGYFAFHRSVSPRFGERARMLRDKPGVLYGGLAPIYCMGIIGAHVSRMLRTWIMVAIVVALIITVRALPLPWYGIVLAGVVMALAWGSISTTISVYVNLAGAREAASEALAESLAEPGNTPVSKRPTVSPPD